MSGTLVVTSAAFGAGDPVQSGKLKLKLSSGFKNQLKSNHVSMKPKSFSLTGGTLDPVAGTGTVNLKGKLTFKKGSKKVVYKKLTAKIGSGGYIKGKSGKVFKLKGGKVVRNGFGANVTGVKLSFLKSAAKAINKKLGLHSLHKGSAGTASANNVQPSTVTLVSGSSELVANLVTFAKFGHHCVNPLAPGGITPVAPATAPSATSFSFPVTGGSLSPLGTSGTARSAILPDVPTIADAGVPGFQATLWVGFMAPAGTPQPIIDRLNSEISKILSRDDIQAAWSKQGAMPFIMTQARFTAFMDGQIATWAKVIKDNHIALIK